MTEESKVHPYIEWAKNRLDEMDATLSTFENKAGDLGDDVSAKAKAALSDMEAQRDAFKEYLDKNMQSAESVWEEQSEKLNRFGFIVDRRASKDQIKAAVEALYEVNVAAVNTMVYGGKTKMRYTKSGVQKGKTSSFKKAIITLEEGQTIDFYSNI